MSAVAVRRNRLLDSAIETIAPLTSEYGAGTANGIPDVVGAVERAATSFRDRIAAAWLALLRQLPPDEGPQLAASLAGMTGDEVRAQAGDVLDRLAPWARVEDRAFALDYLAAIPAALQRSLSPAPGGGWKAVPGLALDSADSLRRLLPDSDALQPPLAAWTRRPGDLGELQKTTDSPLPVLPALEMQKDTPVIQARTSPPPVPTQALMTKMHLLARCHALLAAQRLRWNGIRVLTFVALLFVGGVVSGAAGAGVFHLIWESPSRVLHTYSDWAGTHYCFRGQEIPRGEYDYLQRSYDGGEHKAIVAGLATGLSVALLLLALWWWLVRKPVQVPQLEEQLQAILRDHPDSVNAWGGPAVLRERELVEEIIRLEESGRG
jgi:hypothetical protein